MGSNTRFPHPGSLSVVSRLCLLPALQPVPPLLSRAISLQSTAHKVAQTDDRRAQWFKLVAKIEESEGGHPRYVSIFDGETEYKQGEAVSEEVKPGHKGGIYVCRSVLDIRKNTRAWIHTAQHKKVHPYHVTPV